MTMGERAKLVNSVMVAHLTEQYDVLVEAMKNLKKLKSELTVEEKNSLVKVCKNIYTEANKTRDTITDMKLKESVERNENTEMVQEYLHKHFGDLKNTLEEIKILWA